MQQIPVNRFKRALSEGIAQIGLWVGLSDSYVVELLATCGFDWLLIDAEHAPNDPRSVLRQLQAIAPYSAHPIVRPVQSDTSLVKQYLDLGAQTLLLPMIDTAEQAQRMVAATRYPTRGTRGVGSALARSSRWNQIDRYVERCDDEMCVLVQVETVEALGNLPAICDVEGVDGIFFGPADLSASMGLLGQPGHADVQGAIQRGIAQTIAAGKAAGTLTSDRALAKSYLSAGALFVAVGVDTTLLVRGASELAGAFKGLPQVLLAGANAAY